MTSPVTEHSDATIRRALASYDLGEKLRRLRLRRKIGLVDLGKHTGLSASMLSQLETGKLTPTLPTLARIAMVFDVGLDHFFSTKRRRLFAIVRAKERIRFPDRPGAVTPDYYFENLAFSAQNKGLDAYLAEFPKRKQEEVNEHTHEGAEFLYVLEGTLVMHFADEDYTLRAGDGAYFDGAEPHSYRGGSKKPARALIVTTPPRL